MLILKLNPYNQFSYDLKKEIFVVADNVIVATNTNNVPKKIKIKDQSKEQKYLPGKIKPKTISKYL
jgi:hypothetical protein